jgi:uncharacterized protein (DUF433 family)
MMVHAAEVPLGDIPDPSGAIIYVPERAGVLYWPIPTREALPTNPGMRMRPRNQSNQSGDVTLLHDGGTIVDRGRGPEIAGTRITIYDIMDFLKYGCDAGEIARDLWIEPEQVIAAINYIRSNQEQVDREYTLIVERVSRPNPPEVEQGRATTREELQRRLEAHLERTGADDHTVG